MDCGGSCPDCADGGASSLTWDLGPVARTTQYEYGDPPELLAPLDAAVMRLMQAIVACEEGLVDYPDGCTPWARF